MNDWTHRHRRLSDEEPADDEPTVEESITSSGGGLVPGIAGVICCVLLIIAVGLIVAQFVSGQHGQPGPGTTVIAAHVAGACAGLACYRMTRRPGVARVVGVLAIVVIAVLLLWFFWWSPTEL